MSPGILTISQLNLPMEVNHLDYRCPICGKGLTITHIDRWLSDGTVPLGGLQLSCNSEPKQRSTHRWQEWHQTHWNDPDVWLPVHKEIQQWFISFFRFRPIEPEIVVKKRRMKWRRMG